MRTWGMTDGQYFAVDSVELPGKAGIKKGIRYESMVFRCLPNGKIKNWEELACMRYSSKKDMIDGHNDLVERWIQAVISTIEEF